MHTTHKTYIIASTAYKCKMSQLFAHVRNLWITDSNDDDHIIINDDNHFINYTTNADVTNLIQLLPIELVNLCDKWSFANISVIMPNWIPTATDNQHLKYEISANPHITGEFINNHTNIHFFIGHIFPFSKISPEWILANWYNFNHTCVNCYNNKYDTCLWDTLSLSSTITMEFVEQNIRKPWNWHTLSNNHIFSLDFIKKYIHQQWNWPKLSMNPCITMEFILANRSRFWSWKYLSQNPNITEMFVREHIREKWDWDCLSKHDAITVDFIFENPKKPWNWYNVSENKNLKIDHIIKYPQKPWSCVQIARNNNIVLTELLYQMKINSYDAFYDKLNRYVSHVPYITVDFILKNYDLINISQLSLNPNISANIIDTLPDVFAQWKSTEWTECARIGHISLEFMLTFIKNHYGASDANAYQHNVIMNHRDATIEHLLSNADSKSFQLSNSDCSTFNLFVF